MGAEAEAHSTAEEEQAGAYCLAAVAAGAQSSVVAVGVLIEISRVACAVQGQWAQQGPCWGPRRSSGGAVTTADALALPPPAPAPHKLSTCFPFSALRGPVGGAGALGPAAGPVGIAAWTCPFAYSFARAPFGTPWA